MSHLVSPSAIHVWTLFNDNIDDHERSSTYQLAVPGQFSSSYVDGSGSLGDYIYDNFDISGVTVKSLEMGLAFTSSLRFGLMGVAYDADEASATQDPSFMYPGIISSMVSQGLINAPAYSLYLDDLEASSGSIIFGGLDTDKYTGDLVELPILPMHLANGSVSYKAFIVAMTSFSVSGSSSALSDTPIPVVLDSGTSAAFLPSDIISDLYDVLGVIQSTLNPQLSLVDCDIIDTQSSDTFEFGFGSSTSSTNDGIVIRVPFSEIIWRLLGANGKSTTAAELEQDLPFTNICWMQLLPLDVLSSDALALLGDTFLRSAYVVYDLKNNVIGLAQTKFGSDSSNIVEFQASDREVPRASVTAMGVGASVTATKLPGSVGSPTKSVGGTSTHGSHTQSSTTATSSSTKSAGLASVPALGWPSVLVLGCSAALAFVGGVFTVMF